ncbi:hypothetical protein [Sansalvadorimonas verongulae]|uniref:hypothetical protein n=1 Tax=Sansalvadorimonas verongulae TaxID=2172824 RepID=UPI0012BCA838|nr:hypothetical protein [Sansalvadorimonas verongulae]MTI13890.1 IS6 family transposase [Sansalvadorimonas verongulae]
MIQDAHLSLAMGAGRPGLKFSGRHFPKDIILQTVRWYVSYPLSYRMIEELMTE